MLVLVVVAGAGLAVWRLDLVDRWVTGESPDPSTDPAAVAPPPGLEVPSITDPSPLLDVSAADGAVVDTAAVAAALTPWLADPVLAGRILVGVAPLDADDATTSGQQTYVAGPERVTPASTTKLLTSVAALEALGGDHTFTTSVVDGTDPAAGADAPGRVVLVGGGDPYLAREPVEAGSAASRVPIRADLRTLATETAAALQAQGRTSVQVAYDASLFTGPAVNPFWPADYVPDDVVAPITSLWVDRGRAADDADDVVADPAADAAAWFAGALAEAGIQVVGEPTAGLGGNGEPLATAESAPLENIVERLISVSDNETTEVLAHHVGLAVAGDASFEGGAAATREVLAGLGVDLGGDVLRDGSGLSRENALSAATLLGVVEVAAAEEHPELRPALTGLPVAGFSGSLAGRFDTADPAGLGDVRAKTGTLTGVQGLAGVLHDATGTPLRFVLVADAVGEADGLDARAAIDRAAAALAACVCSTPLGEPEPTPSDPPSDPPSAPASTDPADAATG